MNVKHTVSHQQPKTNLVSTLNLARSSSSLSKSPSVVVEVGLSLMAVELWDSFESISEYCMKVKGQQGQRVGTLPPPLWDQIRPDRMSKVLSNKVYSLYSIWQLLDRRLCRGKIKPNNL